MPYNTATPESLLLKYIQVRSSDPGSRLTSTNLESELRELEKQLPRLAIYRFESSANEGGQLADDLAMLETLGFIDFEPATQSISLTNWGRFCSELFSPDPDVANAFEHLLTERVATENSRAA